MKSSNNNKQKKMEKSDQMYNKMDMHYYNEIYISQYSETKVEEKKTPTTDVFNLSSYFSQFSGCVHRDCDSWAGPSIFRVA